MLIVQSKIFQVISSRQFISFAMYVHLYTYFALLYLLSYVAADNLIFVQVVCFLSLFA
jgi:hypothetical protein